ncbi:trehalose-phosphatase [Herbiconiux solani]|uniref:trehalose-phosphatase n=1 Tax=Herbiconiux solani TaxID=661329 RepID=UPI0008257273|nr:trehalose-phosphatase [Herbiconiux solani]
MSALPSDLREAVQRLAETPELLVALDFDGTLAPEVDRPDDARALPEAQDAVLRLLELPATHVAFISGRAMDSLRHVTGLPESALLVGSHGVEVRVDGRTAIDLDDAERARRDELGRTLEAIADGIDGAWVEEKPAGFALHTRLADDAGTEEATSRALTETDPEGNGLTVRSGKNVLEFSVRSTTKGEAVARLREQTGATAVLFAGDDVTDEDGFAALGEGDLGLKSGKGETRASHRVDGPADVAAVLAALDAARRAVGSA